LAPPPTRRDLKAASPASARASAHLPAAQAKRSLAAGKS